MVLLCCDVSPPDLGHSGVQSAIASSYSLSMAALIFSLLSSVPLITVGSCACEMARRLSLLRDGASFTNIDGTTSDIVKALCFRALS